ncbi:hypothetical protein [Sinomonas sp. P47F7]|uniref:hypothetical protein n=1 Tax=Sinomonas sp. P47F7 TaxID=3410987 RepID=UPI003BF5D440
MIDRFRIKGSVGELVLAIIFIVIAITIPLEDAFWVIFRAVLVLAIAAYAAVVLVVMVRRRKGGPVD